jgi:hypothetical protein
MKKRYTITIYSLVETTSGLARNLILNYELEALCEERDAVATAFEVAVEGPHRRVEVTNEEGERIAVVRNESSDDLDEEKVKPIGWITERGIN